MNPDASWWPAPCDCGDCARANTPRVQFASGTVLHGVPAAKFLASRARGMVKIAEIADRLRDKLGVKAQRGDERG